MAIADQVQRAWSLNRLSEHLVIREKMQGLVAELRYESALAKLEMAYANVLAAIGEDPFPTDITGDGVVNDADRTYLGSPVPKFTGGFKFILRYKGFDLEGYLYTSLGNKIFNVSKWFTDFYPSFQGAAISERVKESWSPQNTGATIPIFESASNFSTNTQSNSFYVEDGSYLRFQNVTLGYNLPTAMLGRLKMTKLRLFIATNNVFTISGYDGLDPSVGGAADTNFGIDVGNYPITRSFTAGLNLGF